MRLFGKRWIELRNLVWARDDGVCQVCGDKIDIAYYECGHKVDRCCGGDDVLENLVVMCNSCNRHKPCHETLEEYEKWAKLGSPLSIIFYQAIELFKAEYPNEWGSLIEEWRTNHRQPDV